MTRIHPARCLALVALLAASLGGLRPSAASSVEFKLEPVASAREAPVSLELRAPGTSVPKGTPIPLILVLKIDEGWHIAAHELEGKDGIPSSVSLAEGNANLSVQYPPGRKVELSFTDGALPVYDGSTELSLYLTFPADAPLGKTALKLAFLFQACDDQNCLLPKTLDLPLSFELGPTAGDANEPGIFLGFAAVYLLGLWLAITPCVYPVIPLTVGFFSAQASGSAGRRLAMALVFGAGIAISFAIYGTVVAFSGALFGAVMQSPWVLAGLSGLCVLMGLNAFGVWELQLPGWLMQLAGGTGYAGLLGALVMGLTMGVVATPCGAAFLVGLSGYVAAKQDVALGLAVFLTVGLGLATPFMVLGTFTGLAAALPRSGMWLVWVKRFMGLVLFGAAIYFALPLFRSKDPRPDAALPGAARPGIPWQAWSEEGLARAAAERKPVLIDFAADWCLPCKELDAEVFRAPAVVEAARGFAAFRADLTGNDDPAVEALRKRHGIQVLPAVVLLGPDGLERQDLRVTGLVDAEDFLKRMRSITGP